MSSITLSDSVQALARPYERRMSGDVSDIREAIALVDLYLRVAYTLVVMGSHADGGPSLRIVASPGFGTMLSMIRGVTQWRSIKREHWTRTAVVELARGVTASVDAFGVRSLYPSFKTLRDRLSHGHALPEDDGDANAVAKAVRDLCDGLRFVITGKVGSCQLRKTGTEVQLVSADKEGALVVSPLWTLVGPDPSVGVYSHWGSDRVYYLASGGDLIGKDGTLTNWDRACLPEQGREDSLLARFVRDVVRDVAAFTEDYSAPGYYFGDDADTGTLFVPWTRSTSDGNQPRVDAFRIGPDHQRQWRMADATWRPYSDFLRDVSNWKLLARRVGIGLDQFSQQREQEEATRLGARVGEEVLIPARLLQVSEGLADETVGAPAFDLTQRVDEACAVLKPSTTVFFIVGQAGLGKTKLMLTEARQRAIELEKAPESPKPLYLFVSSTGRTLASLDDAVNSALNITKLLSSHGAKALCRNGLLVLLVDGFDELLGSSGYENALGSLEPWFRELGGRGVLVASARSSYYLTQYRRSLGETTGINVDHTLVEVQSWNRGEIESYLEQRRVPSKRWSGLSDRDWLLLGVPFFAKAFASWHTVNKGEGHSGRSIFDIVVGQYLERESSKLEDPHRGPLLRPDELREFFSEVAEMMYQEKTRELEHAQLVVCAQCVIGTESLDDGRPGISRRLTSLCGLAVDPDNVNASRFSFSHEVMFDCFLSLAIQRRVKSSANSSGLRDLLDKGKVQRAVFDWLVEREPVNAKRVLEKLLADQSVVGTGALADNLGSFWTSLLSHGRGVPPTATVRGVRLGEVELAEDGWTALAIDECAVENLVIPTRGSGSVHIRGSDVQLLRCNNGSRLAEVLSVVEPLRVEMLYLDSIFLDSPNTVRDELERLGIVPRLTSKEVSSALEAARFYLDKLATRMVAQVIVYESSYLADDDRLRWTKRLGEDAWLEFVRELTNRELARWERISAGGQAKVRLVFEVSPASIAREDSGDPRVAAFWRNVRRVP